MSNGTDILANDDPGQPTSRVVGRLVEILGAGLCAVIGAVKKTSSVREWVEGIEPTNERARVLRFALRVAKTIQERHGSAVAQSWFQGANHALGGEAPALVLQRAGNAEHVEASVADALRVFLDE